MNLTKVFSKLFKYLKMIRIFRRFYSNDPLKLARSIPFEQEINHFLSVRQKISAKEWGELRANLLEKAKNQLRLDNIILTNFGQMQSKCKALDYTKQYLKALPALNIQPTLTNYDMLVRSYCRKSDEEHLTRAEQTELLET